MVQCVERLMKGKQDFRHLGCKKGLGVVTKNEVLYHSQDLTRAVNLALKQEIKNEKTLSISLTQRFILNKKNKKKMEHFHPSSACQFSLGDEGFEKDKLPNCIDITCWLDRERRMCPKEAPDLGIQF